MTAAGQLFFSPVHVECLAACFPSRSSVCVFLTSSSVIQDIKTSTQLSTGRTECTFSWQQEPQLCFLPSSFLIVCFFHLRPLSARAHTLPGARLHPVETSFCLSDTETQPEWQKPKHEVSDLLIIRLGSGFGTYTHRGTRPRTHACLRCVTVSQGRARQTNKGFLLTLRSHLNSEKATRCTEPHPASKSKRKNVDSSQIPTAE